MISSLTSRDYWGYDLAEKVAANSDCRYRMGAVVIRGSRVLSTGINKLKTHTDHKDWPAYVCSIHAEHSAILHSETDLSGATIYVARIGGRRNSKPCPMCHCLLKEVGIARAVFMDNGSLVKVKI